MGAAAETQPTGLVGMWVTARGELRRSAAVRLSVLRWLSLGLLTTLGGTVWVAALAGSGIAIWAGIALLWWAFCSIFVLLGVALLVDPDGARVHRLGLPNGLTMLRAWACLPLFLCAALPLPGDLGLALWCVFGFSIGMLDYVDGYIARRMGPVTVLGRAIDPGIDALFFSMGGAGNLLLGIMPAWLAVLIVVRYLGPFLLTPIVFVLGKRPELVRTDWGKRNTAATGLVMFILMWVRIFHGPVAVVALFLGLPFLVPTMLLHFWSLFQRVREAPRVQ